MMVKNVFNIIRNNKGRFLIMLLLVTYLKLLDNGFCYQTGKFFSQLNQEELINRGIERLLEDHKPHSIHYYGDNGSFEFIDPIIPYDSLEEFKKINPDCCYFHRGEFKSSNWYPAPLLKKITGEIYGYIVLRYVTRRVYPNDMPKNIQNRYPQISYSEEIYSVSVCGKLREVPNWANY